MSQLRSSSVSRSRTTTSSQEARLGRQHLLLHLLYERSIAVREKGPGFEVKAAKR